MNARIGSMIKAEISARFSIRITALRAFIVMSLANSAAGLNRYRGALLPARGIERRGNADAKRRRRGFRTLHWCLTRLRQDRRPGQFALGPHLVESGVRTRKSDMELGAMVGLDRPMGNYARTEHIDRGALLLYRGLDPRCRGETGNGR
jgi:hypothetical protein